MKHALFLLFVLFSSVLFAQEDAWVYFKDKPQSQAYLQNPLMMLSQRALDRRLQQNIVLDFQDVPIEKSYYDQIKTTSGITVLAQSRWMNAVHIRGPQSAISDLKSLSFVERIVFANSNLNSTTQKESSKKVDSKKNFDAVQSSDYGLATNQIQMLHGQDLHQKNFKGNGKIIAVLDAGFPGVDTYSAFQNLRTNNQILGGYNYVSRNANFYTGNSHGTSVLSLIGGYQNQFEVGTAPEAQFYLFITENSSSENPVEESLWVEAAEKADSLGVDIINTSLGYFEYDNPNYSHSYTDMDGKTNFISRGAEIASSKGILVVVSAGNEGNATEAHIGAPADASSVLTVGAVDSAGNRASFSSIGPSADNRIKPEIMAQGQSVYLINSIGTISTSNGTSFSAPIITGLAACLWQAFPNKTNYEIKNLIINSANRLSFPDNAYGYGIPNFAVAANEVLNTSIIDSQSFFIYPNPATSEIKFVIPDNVHTASLIIYSLLGDKVIESKITSEISAISLQKLTKGVYFYTLEGDDFHKKGKIIKK